MRSERNPKSPPVKKKTSETPHKASAALISINVILAARLLLQRERFKEDLIYSRLYEKGVMCRRRCLRFDTWKRCCFHLAVWQPEEILAPAPPVVSGGVQDPARGVTASRHSRPGPDPAAGPELVLRGWGRLSDGRKV